MKTVAQAMNGQAVTATPCAGRIGRDAAFRGASPMPRVIADQGKIRLGGAWRLPTSKKVG
jgi:hypothetical protein